ncbi:50S ribosomal protein L3 [Candidatus Woesearchaeota archaeon]|nr:50S ribosomal protein L3 [Candidatus Woesearchaeota archaeon]
MPTIKKPRSGSMQYWPRKRAKREIARVRSFASGAEPELLGFAGYKAGMTHVMMNDNKATSKTKGQEIFCPVTIIECPALIAASIIFYKKTTNGLKAASAVMASNLNKELKRRISIPKSIKKKIEDFKAEEYDDIRMLVYTQPKLTTIGKKKPELFEIQLNGKIEEKLAWAKDHLGKEIQVTDVLKEGQHFDIHAITKGKGYQGPMKRFGISRTSHKSEKGVRTPANIGPWTGAKQWTVAKAGQTGYHQRIELSKWLIKVGTKPEEINNKSGFKRYGIVKNPFILVKGSVAGPVKRLIILTNPLRPNKKIPKEAPSITYISK